MKKFGNKAFTLIELMIVVVILGVLMSTILPKLTGAQARARDAGRVSDIGNISAALQVYYDDNGSYPGTDGAGYCLGSGTTVTDKLRGYMQSQKVPVDPQTTANSYLCGTPDADEVGIGRYYYAPLEKDGLAQNSYVLCADMETLQKANTNAANIINSDASDIVAAKSDDTANELVKNNSNADTSGSTYEDLLAYVGIFTGDNKLSAEPSDGTNKIANASLYCILRP